MVLVAAFSSTVLADDAAIRSGDTAWLMTSTALVLFMTIPGLALFYAGMVHVVDIIGHGLDELGCLGRLGGEEFGIFITIPDVSQQSTAALAQADSDFENIRQTLEKSPLQWNEHVLNLTISTGVSLYRDGEKVEETLSRADAGVYQAKEGGRNKVVVVS